MPNRPRLLTNPRLPRVTMEWPSHVRSYIHILSHMLNFLYCF